MPDPRPRFEPRATCFLDFEDLPRATLEEDFLRDSFFVLRAVVLAFRDFDPRPAGSASVTEHVTLNMNNNKIAICFLSLFEVIRTARPLDMNARPTRANTWYFRQPEAQVWSARP